MIRYTSVPFPSRLHCTGTVFGAVQVQNCPSFLAGTKQYLIAGTKLHLITISSVNARLIRKTFVSDQKVIWYSVNAALSGG